MRLLILDFDVPKGPVPYLRQKEFLLVQTNFNIILLFRFQDSWNLWVLYYTLYHDLMVIMLEV